MTGIKKRLTKKIEPQTTSHVKKKTEKDRKDQHRQKKKTQKVVIGLKLTRSRGLHGFSSVVSVFGETINGHFTGLLLALFPATVWSKNVIGVMNEEHFH